MIRFVLALVGLGMPVFLLSATGLAGEVAAQADALSRQTLRPYLHVFVAYAVAWLLVLGWVISIARRLGRVEEELGEGSESRG